MGKSEIDAVILGMLLMGPAHGYEIKQRIDRTYARYYINLSVGSLYTRLTLFEKEGLIEGKREFQDKVPDKRVFQLTDAGRKRFKEILATPIDLTGMMWTDLQAFTVHAIFLNQIPKEQRENIIKPYRDSIKEQLDFARISRDKYASSFDKPQMLTMVWGIDFLEKTLQYLEGLLEIE